MATIRIASDNIQNKTADTKTLNAVADLLRQQGHTVTTHGIGPNKIQSTMLKKANKCDIMIQIAGGKCLGTLVDFYLGIGKYYHASQGVFLYFKCWDPSWKSYQSGDDKFSQAKNLAPYKGKTLPEIFSMMKDKMSYGYGNTAEDLVKTYNGSSSGASSDSQDTGTSILELIKQVSSDNDKYGVELQLVNKEVHIKRTNPNSAVLINPHDIIGGQVTFNDYDNTTPNEYQGYKDNFLIERYGVIPCDDVNSSWKDQVLLMAQRGHGHTIDLKVVLDSKYVAGRWVKISLPELGITNRPYFITKHSYDEDMQMSLTLEPGPPSLYVEIQEETEEEVSEDESTMEEE